MIPAHNAERFIGAALASALGQSHSELEVVVVDDGSTDGTAAVVESWARRDPRVRLVRTARRGVGAARNLAVAEARGALIAPLDADDLWAPEKLARQLAVLRAAPADVGLVYCWSRGVDETGRVIMASWSRRTATGAVLDAVIVENFVGNASTALFRRAAFEATGGYDPDLRLGEDWKLHIALAGVCRFAVVPEHLAAYRFTDANSSLDGGWEAELAETTAWIRRTWPGTSAAVLRERAFSVDRFLIFWAIRAGSYRAALRFRLRAIRNRPLSLFGRDGVDFVGLMVGRILGIRRYTWSPFTLAPFPTAGAGD